MLREESKSWTPHLGSASMVCPFRGRHDLARERTEGRNHCDATTHTVSKSELRTQDFDQQFTVSCSREHGMPLFFEGTHGTLLGDRSCEGDQTFPYVEVKERWSFFSSMPPGACFAFFLLFFQVPISQNSVDSRFLTKATHRIRNAPVRIAHASC